MCDLGVGLVYSSALHAVFEAGADTVAVLELEPQTLWEKIADAGGLHYQINEAALARVASLPQAKLVHSVGHPVGGMSEDPLEHMPLLRRTVDVLDPAWVSEHLSFNRIRRMTNTEEAGFLLPPRQSIASVRIAVRNIARFGNALRRPLAFETGVNYLRQRDDELDDGDFFGAVSTGAQCGILLDLHNLWCNEINGRARVIDVLKRIPLDQVWEVHLAGGMSHSGYYLDAHSDAIPSALLDIAAEVIPRLSNLGALIFEILPEHVPRIGIDGVERQLEELRSLWSLKPAREVRPSCLHQAATIAPLEPDDLTEIEAWETSLIDAIRGRNNIDHRFGNLADDPGLTVLRELVNNVRSAHLARMLRYTLLSLLAGLGKRETHSLLAAYFDTQAPDAFAGIEADHFAHFLREHDEVLTQVPYLQSILIFEHALVRAAIYGIAAEIEWNADPALIFDALDAGHLPRDLPPVTSKMRVCLP